MAGLGTTGAHRCVRVRISTFVTRYLVDVDTPTLALVWNIPSDLSTPMTSSTAGKPVPNAPFPYGFTVLPWTLP